MAGVTKGSPFGFKHMWVSRLSTTNIGIGQQNPASLTNGATSNAYKVTGTVEATLPTYTYDQITFRDGNSVQGVIDNGLTSVDTGSVTMNTEDATLVSLLVGGNVDTTSITNTTIYSENANISSPYNVAIGLCYQQYSRDAATLGQTKWVTVIFPVCSCRLQFASPNQSSGENPMTVALSFYPRNGNKFVTGAAFGANQSWQDNQTLSYRISADYPFFYTAFIGNGALGTFTTGYLPIYETMSGGNTNSQYALNGTVTAFTSHVATTGVVTMGSTPANQVIAGAFFQTNFLTA